MSAHYFIFAWAAIVNGFILMVALFKNESVPPSLDFLSFFMPLVGVPLMLLLCIIGIVTASKAKYYRLALAHIGIIIGTMLFIRFVSI